MSQRESTTIDAINTLKSRGYPYAASLLVYVLIEQELKFWLLHNRGRYKKSRVDDSVKVGGKRLRTYITQNNHEFIKECLELTRFNGRFTSCGQAASALHFSS